MTNFSKVANDAKKLAAQYKAVLDLVDAVKEIASIEAAKNELEAAYKEAADRVEEVKAEVDQQERQFHVLKGHVDIARKELAEVRAEAEKEAKGILNTARSRAAEMLSEAEQDCDRKRAVTDSAVASAKAALNLIHKDIAAAKNKYNDVQAELAKLKEKFGG